MKYSGHKKRALLLSLGVICAAPFATLPNLNAQPAATNVAVPNPAPQNLPAPIFTRQSSFAIPYTVPMPRTPQDQPAEVRLFVSSQFEKKWQTADVKKLQQITQPLREQFVYESKQDGEYWFAIRTVDAKGQMRGGKAGPELRVIVDTQQPTIKLEAERAVSGAVSLRWEMVDPLLVPETLTISYQAAGRTEMRTVAVDKGSQATPGRPIQGTASFWPDPKDAELQLRAEVRDRAGNIGQTQITLNGTTASIVRNGSGSIGTNANTNSAATTVNTSKPAATGSNSATEKRTGQGGDQPPQFPFAGQLNEAATNKQPSGNNSFDSLPSLPGETNNNTSPSSNSNSLGAGNTSSVSGVPNTNSSTTAQPKATNGMRLAPSEDGPNLFAPLNSATGSTSGTAAGTNNFTVPSTGETQPQNVANPYVNNNNNNNSPKSNSSSGLTPPIQFLPPVDGGTQSSNIGTPLGGSAFTQQGLPPTGGNQLTPIGTQNGLPALPGQNPSPTSPQQGPLSPRVESQVVPSDPNVPRSVLRPTTSETQTEQNRNSLGTTIDYKLPNGKLPTMVNSRTFEWDYAFDSVPLSGIAQVELWITRDSGRTWDSAGIDEDRRSPIRTKVELEGVYGYRITVQGNGAARPQPPQSGDQPEMWIGVDLTKPIAKLVNAELGTGNARGEIAVTWEASDTLLKPKPVTILYSDKPNGPWKPLAANIENTGRHSWRYDDKTPDKIYFRLEVRDIAGNIGTSEAVEPVDIGRNQADGKLQGVKPVQESQLLRRLPANTVQAAPQEGNSLIISNPYARQANQKDQSIR